MDPRSHFTKFFHVKVDDVRNVRNLIEQAGQRIHSNGYMDREEKIIVLGKLKRAKAVLDGILQLDLFSQSQLK